MRRTRKKKGLNRGRWQVERERCRLEQRSRPASRRDACRISQVIPGLMKKLGMEDQHWLTVLEEEWASLVGEAVAKHTRPGRFERRNLVIFVDSSVWLNELVRYGRDKILLNLQKRFGGDRIRSVNLQMDPEG